MFLYSREYGEILGRDYIRVLFPYSREYGDILYGNYIESSVSPH